MSKKNVLMIIGLLALLNFAIPFLAQATTAPVLYRNLHKGSSGKDVGALQVFLKSLGFYTYPEITAYFGSLTGTAVTAFQRANGIDPVGSVGPQTRMKIARLSLSTPPVPAAVSQNDVVVPLWGGSSSRPTDDTSAPTVSINSPQNGQVIYGSAVNFTASASDNINVAGVKFYVNGVLAGKEITTPPFTMMWDSTATSSGSRSITAVASDDSNNTTTSSAVTVTIDNDPPVISAVSSCIPGSTSAIVTWTTDENADSQVSYGPTASYNATTTLDSSLVTSHSVTISSLAANTTYHFQIRSADAHGNLVLSADQTFNTTLVYSVEAQQFFCRLSTQPSSARKQIYDTLISGLKSTGVWDKLDALYVLAAPDASTAKINLIQNDYNLSVVGSPTFAADSGYTGTGTKTSYLNTTFNPTVGTHNFTLNSASLFAWKNTAPVGDHGLIIGATSEAQYYIQAYGPGDNFEVSVNGGGSGNSGGIASQTGLFGASRTASNLDQGYYNGIPLASSHGASTMPSVTFRLVGDANDTTTSQVSVATIGGGLSTKDVRNLTTYIQNYMNDIANITPTVKYGYSSDIVNDGANNYAPALGRLNDGRLITAYTVADGNGINGKMVYRTSSDNGFTWSSASDLVIPATGNNVDVERIKVLTDGSILIDYVDQHNDGSNNTTKIIKGTVANDLSISWAAPTTITSGSITHPAPYGPILQLQNGNLLLGLEDTSGTDTVVTSSDNGATWGNEHTVLTKGGGINAGYISFVQKLDSTIIGIFRNDPTTGVTNPGYWTISSTDNGATWSTPTLLFQNNNPNEASLIITPAGALFFVGRGQIDGVGAYALYSYSTDGGTTWSALTRYYSFGTRQYGDILESQGFYDSSTNSVLYAIGLGNYTGAGQVIFHQFFLP